MKKKKILLISGLLTVLGVMIFSTVSIFAAGKPKLSEVSIKGAYPVETTLDIPQAVFTLKDVEKEAHTILHMPDGSSEHLDKVVLSQTGEYILEYSAYFNGRRYSERYAFDVYTQIYTIQNTKQGTAAYHTDYAFAEYDGSTSSLKGLFVELPAGAEFRFNKVIDFSDKQAQDEFIKFAILPNEIGTVDARYMYLVLTDAHDSNNYVTMSFHDMEYAVAQYGQKDNYENMRKYWYSFVTSYAKAGSNYQTLTGLNGGKPDTSTNYGAMVGPSFHGVTEIDYDTGLSKKLFVQDGFKTVSLDYKNKEMYCSNQLVIDLDSTEYFTELWKGFTTGEAYLSLYFGEYSDTDCARVFIEDIDGNDLSNTDFYDVDAPKITVQEPEEGIYDGLVGLEYPIFSASAVDSYDGMVPVNTSVYYNYYSNYRQSVDITDEKFVPDREGFYSLVYTAEDTSGNQSTQIVTVFIVEQSEDIKFILADSPKEVSVGQRVEVAKATVENVFGKCKTKIYVTCGEEKYSVKNGTFLPKTVGTHTVVYEAEDALGRTKETSYIVEVRKSDAPVFYEEPVFPKYLMSGKTYALPEVVATGYKESDKGTEIKTKVYITDNAGRREIIGNSFTPIVSASGQKVTLEYVATEGKTVGTLTKKIPCYVVMDGNKVNIAGYFAKDSGIEVLPSEETVKVQAKSDNRGFEFINELISSGLNLELTVDKAAAQFGKLHIYYTDSRNENISVKLTVAKAESGSLVSINDSQQAYSFKFSYTKDSTSLLVQLNDSATAFLFPNESKILYIENTLLGEPFVGFPSGKVYMKMVFEGVNGDAAINIRKIDAQMMQVLDKDKIVPRIALAGEYKTSYKINTEVDLYKALAGDVLQPSMKEFYLSVKNPKGKVIVDKLNLLDDKNAEKKITVKLEEYGAYILSYTAVDCNGGKIYWSQNLNVQDDEKPIIKVKDKMQKEATVGKKVNVSTASATDNVDGEVQVFVFLENPEGAISILVGFSKDTYSFVPNMTGTYIVKYVAFDSAQNMTVEMHKIAVK